MVSQYSLARKNIVIGSVLVSVVWGIWYGKSYRTDHRLIQMSSDMLGVVREKQALPSCFWSDFMVVPEDPLGQKGPFLTVGIRLDHRVPMPVLSPRQAERLRDLVGHGAVVYYLQQDGTWGLSSTGRLATIFVPIGKM